VAGGGGWGVEGGGGWGVEGGGRRAGGMASVLSVASRTCRKGSELSVAS